jgi:hypothetical protein
MIARRPSPACRREIPAKGVEDIVVGGTSWNLVESKDQTCVTLWQLTTADHIHSLAKQRPRLTGENNEGLPMTAGPAQSRPRRTTMPTTQQRQQHQDMEQHQRELLNALIGEQVLYTLGEPGDLFKVQVRLLWGNYYRVNVLLGADATSARIAKSYFVEADSDANIVKSSPKITKQY